MSEGVIEMDVKWIHSKSLGELKEERIRLAAECNQCVYITECDETGGEGRRLWQDAGRQRK